VGERNRSGAGGVNPRPQQARGEGESWLELMARARIFLRGQGRRGGLLLVCAVLVSILNAVEPLVMKLIVDTLTAREPFSALLTGLLLLLAVGLTREGVGAAVNWLTWRIRLSVHEDLLERLLEKVGTLPLEFHREEGVGGLMTRIDRSISGFLQALQDLMTNLLPAAIYLLTSAAIMVRLEWRMSLLVIAFTPLVMLIGVLAAPEQARREASLLDQWIRLYSRFNEVLTGIVTVRSFAMEDREKHRFLVGLRRANRQVIRGVSRDSGVGAARNLVSALARLAAVAYGGWLVLQGEITVGTLIAFLGYVGGLFGPLLGLTNAYQTVRKAGASLEGLFGILEREVTLGDAPDALDLDLVTGHVRFEDIHFSYDPQRPLLQGVSLEALPGETVALVGPSGSGKSTLMALLQRLYDPVSGRVLLDGRDLRTLRQRALRRHLGMVLQEPILFDDPVRDNIAYGNPSASRDAIEAAARAANAHDFIERLPHGYDTPVGERGSRLSVGERQRVSIARALLKDPAILILDEPTSALDAESEQLVKESVERLVEGRTTFVIAHRLTTVVAADRIAVLSHGEIIEEGDHRSLMRQGGYYARLVGRQVEGLLPDAPARRMRA
jgi:ATP-binding cassette subfamily B protein